MSNVSHDSCLVTLSRMTSHSVGLEQPKRVIAEAKSASSLLGIYLPPI